jgi:hypothetical protein
MRLPHNQRIVRVTVIHFAVPRSKEATADPATADFLQRHRSGDI